MTTETRTIDPAKLLDALNERPDQWLNIIQTLSELTPDELADAPTGHARFEVLLAASLAEHTTTFDDDGEILAEVDVYS